MSRASVPPAIAVSVDEAAAMVGVSKSTMYRFVLSGEIPSVKLGWRRLVRVAAIEDWMAGLEVGGGDSAQLPHVTETQ